MRVYVVSDGNGHHKIGIANSVRSRLDCLQTGNALQLTVVYSIETADPHHVESYAHWLLRDRHVRGEWFRADEREVVLAVDCAQAAVTGGARTLFVLPRAGRAMQPCTPYQSDRRATGTACVSVWLSEPARERLDALERVHGSKEKALESLLFPSLAETIKDIRRLGR